MKNRLMGLATAMVVAAWMTPASAQTANGSDEYAPRGAKTCQRCHDENEAVPVLSILRTPHAQKADVRTPFAARDCESCHGPSPDHYNKPEKADGTRIQPAVNFGPRYKSPAVDQNKMCLQCHERDKLTHWQGSQHDMADVACSSCHKIHAVRDPVMVRDTMPDVCFKCHKPQQAQSTYPSHHPIREGKVVCADCHNPHGSAGTKLLAKATVVETCYQCHAEKRGPFLWDHAPVRDSCINCHTPHGSVNDRLLKARPPWLCQQCHSVVTTGHPRNLISGTTPTGTTFASKSCLNCHSQIHGSNHPSGIHYHR